MHACYCAPYRKGCVSAKAFYPSGQEIPWDKKSPRQEIPRDKKSPGIRNRPGQKIPGTRNPPGQGIPRDKNPPGNPGQELLVFLYNSDLTIVGAMQNCCNSHIFFTFKIISYLEVVHHGGSNEL